MNIVAMNPGLRIMPADVPAARPVVPNRQDEASFGDRLRTAIAGVEAQGYDAQSKVSGLVEGNGTDVHDAMIAVQKADLSFQLMLQVRNKVVQAYQEIERMQF